MKSIAKNKSGYFNNKIQEEQKYIFITFLFYNGNNNGKIDTSSYPYAQNTR